ncbi:MAG: alpha/beta hydrolase [Gemmatimonadota bacterium]|nr:MAG: alpha/beta hydrolase [Gemmatimonadota bacterium]
MIFVSLLLSLMLNLSAEQPDTLTFQQIPYLYETDFCEIDSIKVAFIDKGQGEPILFIHGVGSDLSQWDLNYPDLAQKYRVLGIDLPGFGKSDKPRIDYTMNFYSAVIETLLTRQKIEKATLIGHSFGGHLAAYFSLHHKERVKNLIIVDGAGIQEFTPEQKQFILTQYDLHKLSNPNPNELRFGLQMGFVKWEDTYEKTVQERIALSKSPEYKDYAFAVNKCVMAMLDKNVKKELPQVKAPTLIVWGAKDALVPISVAQEAHELIAGSELTVIPECGHFPMIEKSGEFNRIIDTFLGGKDE